MTKLVECPKCGKMIDNRGLTVHIKFCKGTNDNPNPAEQDKNESTKQCAKCKSKNVLRLDEYQSQSGKQFKLGELYKLGYTHVCVDCGEILK